MTMAQRVRRPEQFLRPAIQRSHSWQWIWLMWPFRAWQPCPYLWRAAHFPRSVFWSGLGVGSIGIWVWNVHSWVFVLGAPLLGALSRSLLRRAIDTALRGVLNDDCKRCLNCGYRLHGLPHQHACPECGTSYEIGDLEASWNNIIAQCRK